MDPRLIRRVRRRDRIATWVITAGGLSVIVCVLGILVLIARVAFPLFLPASTRLIANPPAPVANGESTILAVGLDEFRSIAFTFTDDGALTFFRTANGEVLQRHLLSPPGGGSSRLHAAQEFGALNYSLRWANGALSVLHVSFKPEFAGDGTRTIVPQLEELAAHEPPPGEPALRLGIARFAHDAGLTVAKVLRDGTLRLYKQVVATSLFGGSSSEDVRVDIAADVPGQITQLLLDPAGETLYAATDSGYLLRWDVRDPNDVRLLDRVQAFADGRAISALGLAVGHYTLAVGDELGGVTGWFPVATGNGSGARLTQIHRLSSHSSPVVAFLPSLRAKTLLSLDRNGTIHADQLTDESRLLTLATEQPLLAVGLNSRANGLVGLDAAGQVLVWELNMPHPEASWATYFGKLWYESYPGPAFVWQSSAGTDDFEPKFSLVPLIAGTLKGTFYGMLFAAPLGVLGAMYTSSLMHPRLRGTIKPVFEVMGSIPTVVVGFLAALWLAPIVKASLTAFFLMLGLLPLSVVAALALFEWLQGRDILPRSIRGYEFLLMLPVTAVALGAAFAIGRGLDVLVFGGGMPEWLFNQLGVRFDQRNSIVISFAMGFAVLPIVFSISDDALTNVPRNLTAASLALGASRWQTVSRVILPSASPGIFAALMVGFGRAVGETMIVLMATGNTPIIDWSPFNGMRTLAANIAVEIPEAPFGGTLYRTLFLSAVLLFATTFVLNSVAEVVRIRLRRKFGQY
jgi:phosphate transport system permease protein